VSDIERAARMIMALIRGEQTDQAQAGAMLVADALITIRGFDGAHLKWPHGRGGL
jgi:hypothetical protein